MTRQYIGARYVVKIYENSQDLTSAEWEASTNYEPLTMVTYNNGSYLSKKEVPATIGNPASNGAYWVQTGFYNGQIAALESAVNAINGSIGTLSELETSIKDSLVDAINEIYTDVNAYRRVIIGDSYNVASVVNPTWGSLVNDYLGDCINFGYGARGFASSNTFYDSFSADLSSITDKDSVKEVIVCAGANDVGQTKAAIKTAISNFNTLVTTNFVNAVLKIGFIGWSRSAGSTWNDTYRYYKEACQELGIEYLNGVEVPLHNVKYLQNTSGNTHHPNTDGSAALAKTIVNAILTGDGAFEETDQVTIVQTGTHKIPTNSQYLYTNVKNGVLTVKCSQITYGNTGGTESGTTTLPNNSLITIGNISESFLNNLGVELTYKNIKAMTAILDTSNNIFIPIEVLIYGNGIVAIRNVSGSDITAGFGGKILTFCVSFDVCNLV